MAMGSTYLTRLSGTATSLGYRCLAGMGNQVTVTSFIDGGDPARDLNKLPHNKRLEIDLRSRSGGSRASTSQPYVSPLSEKLSHSTLFIRPSAIIITLDGMSRYVMLTW
jgi:hypothetical protein